MILGCSNLKVFESIKPSAIKGDQDPVARQTALGWMVVGRTRPEVSSDAAGEALTLQGRIGTLDGTQVREINYEKSKKLLNHFLSLQKPE